MKEQDDIFNHLKSVLRNHEEPYDEGAWERFAAQGKMAAKKSPVIAMWKWAAAAAVIAGVVTFGFFYTGKESDIDAPLVVDVPVNTKPADSSASSGNNTLAAAEQKDDIPSFDKDKKDVHNSATAVLPQTSPKTIGSQTPWLLQPDTVLTPTVQPAKQLQVAKAPVTDKPQVQQPEVDFWKNNVVEDNRQDQKPVLKDNNRILIAAASEPTEKRKRSEKSSKWQPGIFISPMFGDLGMNMGYGFSLGYAINDKIKISSGIAHTKITASRSYDATPASLPSGSIMADQPLGKPVASMAKSAAKTMSANSYVTGPQQISTLQQIDGSLSGIDIPVEVNYNIGKKIYASAGVSGLVVINDNKKYTYLDSRNEKVSVQSSNGSQKEDRSVMFNEQSVTSQPIEATGEHIPFLGFYNLSVGFRQKLSGKNAVSVEPFIKMPMQGATRQNLNYNGSGIRLKFDF